MEKIKKTALSFCGLTAESIQIINAKRWILRSSRRMTTGSQSTCTQPILKQNGIAIFKLIVCLIVFLLFASNSVDAIEEKVIEFDMPKCSLMNSNFFNQIRTFTFEASPVAIRFNNSFMVLTQNGKMNKCSVDGNLLEIKDFHIDSPVSFDSKKNTIVILHNNGRTLSGFKDSKNIFKIEILDQLPYLIKPHRVIFIDGNNILVMDKFSCNNGVFSSDNGKFRGVILFQKPVESAKYIIEDIKYYDKHFYLVIQNQDRIIKFDRNGKYKRSIAGSGFDNGRLNYPSGIDFDICGNLYIADYWNNRIIKFFINKKNLFHVLKEFDKSIYPASIVIDSNSLIGGAIFPWNNKLILFDMDQLKEAKNSFEKKDYENTALLLKALKDVGNDKQKDWITYYLSYLDFQQKNFKTALENLRKLLNKGLQRDRLFYKIYRLFNIIRLKNTGKL